MARRAPGKDQSEWTRVSVLRKLSGLANPGIREKMKYFGVKVPLAYGISTPILHKFAKQIGKNHELANQLWASRVHEAKILATLIGEPEKVTSAEMDRWALEFDSWDVVDAACCYLFASSKFAWKKTASWSKSPEPYIKRAAFSLAAYLSYKDKQAPDARFAGFLRVIERKSDDERHFVKKAVNWALRNIGKRSQKLNREAIRVAEKLRRRDSRAARWIAADALRELRSDPVQRRLIRKSA